VPPRVCIDASLAIKLVIPESFSDRALVLWQNWIETGVECIAPSLFPFCSCLIYQAFVFLSYSEQVCQETADH